MTGGAFGSLFAQLFHLSSAERKTLLVAGAAAGMSADLRRRRSPRLCSRSSFSSSNGSPAASSRSRSPRRSPRSRASRCSGRPRLPGSAPRTPARPRPRLGAARSRPRRRARVRAAHGARLRLSKTSSEAPDPLDVVAGDRRTLRRRRRTDRLRASSASATGTIQQLLLGTRRRRAAAASLVVTKSLVWSLALGSGTSGGVLAPLLMMGGALGSLASAVLPHGRCRALGDARDGRHDGRHDALAADRDVLRRRADARLEPASRPCSSPAWRLYAVTVLLLRRSILTEKIARRGHHVFREYSVDPFDIHRVGEVMDRDVPTVPTAMSVPSSPAGSPAPTRSSRGARARRSWTRAAASSASSRAAT